MNIIEKFIKLLEYNCYKNNKIIVFGDNIIDEHYQCEMTRISPECPIPIIKLNGKKPIKTSGGAAKVYEQIKRFTNAYFISVEEHHGNYNAKIPVKSRYYCGNNQVSRIDDEFENYKLNEEQLSDVRNVLLDYFNELKQESNVVVLSDYNKGLFDEEYIKSILSNCEDVITIVDPKLGPASKWYGCTIFKPNYKEAILMTGTKDWKKQCDILMKETNCKVCIITNEGKGVYYKTYDEYGEYVPKNTINVQSVVGAGDCFISFISICQSLNLSIKESIEIAFFASSIYVQKLNGYAIDLNDLKKHHDNCNAKIVNSDFEFNSNDLVFTNGCFDAGLTPAHIECLKFAKKQGEKLVVALNSDNSVKRLKGEKRPIYSLEDRMKIVSSLEFVDYVTWFEEDTPLEIIKKIKPKKIVKGGDYHPEDVVGKEYAEVIIFNFQECVSTTEKLKQLNLI